MKEVKVLKNISKDTLLVKVNGIKKEVKAGDTFETPKYKELLRMYKSRFEIVEKVEKVEKKVEKKRGKKAD